LVGAGTLALAVTLLGGALRLYRLGDRGFWYDEIVTADYARLGTPGDVVDLVRYWGDHAPLAYLITWALRGLGGSEWAVRLHYALAGTLAVFAMYLLGRALLGKSGGLLAALFMAISPFAVYYGQEARPYTYMLLFSCLQALAAYRAAERSRPLDWLLLALWTVLNLYTHYVALAVTAVCIAYIAVSLAVDTWRAVRAAAPERKGAWRRVGSVMAGAGASAGLAALGYLTWLDAARAFFERRDVGFGRYPPAPVTLTDLGRMLDSLGLTGLVLAAVVLGLAGAVALVWRGPRRPGVFLVLWAALPFAYMWWRLGPTIVLLPPRYVMFWFPLVVLLAALGVGVAAEMVRRLVGRIALRAAGQRIAYSLSAVAVVIWMLPGLVGSYAVEKDQFREGAAYVLGEQSGRGLATVLVGGEIGTKLLPPFVVEAVEYYFWLHQAPVDVMDGTRLGRGMVERMELEGRTPWLAFYTDVAEDKRAEARAAGFDVAPFRGVTFVRAVGGDTSPGGQLGRLLDLATAWYPQLVATRSALDEAFRDEHTGDNLLPPVRAVSDVAEETWRTGPGASVDEGRGAFALDPAGRQADVALVTRRLVARRSYVLLFRADNEALTGKQMVYVKTEAADGRALEDVPDWRGYRVRPDNGSERQGVAFTVPDEAAAVTVRFAAEGKGSARVWDVELRPVR
jgi:4-amino-4-deoxy-L-arabinose transferase-like glycosyltransferase